MLNMATVNDLPKEFDVVVLGTGMPESIVAAAFSRIGQSVLHLDRNDHYSGDWASFNLKGLEAWTQCYQDGNGCSESDLVRPAVDESSLLEEGETLIQLPINNTNFSHADIQFYVEESDEFDEETIKEDKYNKSNNAEAEPPTAEDKQKESIDTIPSTDCDKSEAKVQLEGTDDLEHVKPGFCEEKTDSKPEHVNETDSNTKKDKDESQIESQLHDLSTSDIANNKRGLVDTEKVEKKLPVIEAENIESKNRSKEVLDDAEAKPEAKSPDLETIEQETSEDSSKAKIPENRWTVKRLKAEWRKFNIDISPKVLYSVGDMVELLISSDIAKYCEFKTITQIITLMNGILERVPCSRADVFSSKKVSMLEKRMLMKFLQFCLQYENKPEEIGDFLEKPFNDFLTHKKLTPTIKHYIQHSIAMATDSMTTKEGLEKMKKFLKSLGRYGNTAFLWSLYGSGELPQSFCRMCAVFGGVYCLRLSASSVVMDSENRCCAVITTDGQKIKCKWLILEGSYAPAPFICTENNCKTISRAIILTEKPLLTTGQQEQLSLMNLQCPDDGDRPITVLELPPSSMAAPLGVYVYHLTRKGKCNVLPKDDLKYAVTTLFSCEGIVNESKPAMLWTMFFTQKDMSEVQASSSIPDNVVMMAGPGTDIDIDRPVMEAKEVFKRILPQEEFLPKAPNPEDIIYVDDSEALVADGSSQSEFLEKNDTDTSSGEVTTSQEDTTSQEMMDTDKLECSETDQLQKREQSKNVDESEPRKLSSQSEEHSQRTEDSPKIEADQSEISYKDLKEQEIS